MTLRRKTILITAGTLVILMAILYAGSRFIFLNNLAKIERQYVLHNTQRSVSVLNRELDWLNSLDFDWANWDDTYNFMANRNPGFVKTYVNANILKQLGIDLIAFVDLSGKVFLAKSFDLSTMAEIPVPNGLQNAILQEPRLFQHKETRARLTGIMALSDNLILMASRPVVTSESQGPIRGALIFGKYLDSMEIEKISRESFTTVNIISREHLLTENKTIYSKMNNPGDSTVFAFSSDQISGFVMLPDINGRPALILEAKMPRDIYKEGRQGVALFLIFMLGAGFVLGTTTLLFLERAVLLRLSNLGLQVEKIGKSEDLSVRVKTSGKDELSYLSEEINNMLAALENSKNEIKQSQDNYRQLVDLSPVAIIVHSQERLVYVNPSAVKLLKAEREEDLVGRSLYDLIPPEDREKAKQRISLVKSGKKVSTFLNAQMIKLDGQMLDVDIISMPLVFQGEPSVQVVIHDITESKQTEKQLRYLSTHDSLTGLYNRSFFETELARLDNGRNFPVSIVVIDMDGLKKVNDGSGHQAGDKLLQQTATLLKEGFRAEDVVARVGGDEFSILMPKADSSVVDRVLNRIRADLEFYNNKNQDDPLSFSCGAATGEKNGSLEEVLRQADLRMYQKKHSKSQESHH